MLLLTMVYENDKIGIINELRQMKEYFKERDILIGISENMSYGFHFLRIFCSNFNLDKEFKNKFNLYISNILYKIIIKEFYNGELQEYLTDSYFFLKNDEIEEIMKKSVEILKDENKNIDQDMIYCMNKKNGIIDKIKECVEENEEINIDGFITFRMRHFKNDLENIVTKVVEKFMAEEEYNEFIKLLKYFVDIQESKIKEINIGIDGNGDYIIQDEDEKDIMDKIITNVSENEYTDIDDVVIEDLIVSGLITYSPKKVIIHCEDNCKNKEFLNTIKSVFEKRVEFCDNCKMCKKIKKIKKV